MVALMTSPRVEDLKAPSSPMKESIVHASRRNTSNNKKNNRRRSSTEKEQIAAAAAAVVVGSDACTTTACSSSSSSSSRSALVARLEDKFRTALTDLDVNVSDSSKKIESMSNFIYESMSTDARNYHRVEHVFELIDTNMCASTSNGNNKELPVLDSIAVLAALFHDCIYVTIETLSKPQHEQLQGAIVSDDDKDSTMKIASASVLSQDPLVQATTSLFGFSPDQVLDGCTGLNEYLSAIIAVRHLEDLLSFERLVQVAVCIEASTPFRPINKKGKSALDLLHDRLVRATRDHSLSLSQDDCVRAVQRGALMANEDVGNFGLTDHAMFLDKTWSLLPETNIGLRDGGECSVRQYLTAISKIHLFFTVYRPTKVFQQYKGVPETEIVTGLEANADRNIEVATKYIAAKILSVSVLAAITELTTGTDSDDDVPMQTFRNNTRWEAALVPPEPPCPSCDDVVYDLLFQGRHTETSFDSKRSPLAAYFYARMGDECVQDVLFQLQQQQRDATTRPFTQETAMLFLRTLPSEQLHFAVRHVADCMTPASRKVQTMHVLQSL